MKVVFRADASVDMGTGHVMRCLTLADKLSEDGTQCHFICRSHAGNLIDFIESKGHSVHVLGIGLPSASKEPFQSQYGEWLGASQENDAIESRAFLSSINPDWLIVDHYGIDQCWESLLRSFCKKIMLIDDLANRVHDCDLLLDQTFGRQASDYNQLVPRACQVLCGATYTLLRPTFSSLRHDSFKRREPFKLNHLLISLGGVDKDNVTGRVLRTLHRVDPACFSKITVVMGGTAPWLKEVSQLALKLLIACEVRVNVTDMAELMADCDLAIGAAGATSWERCCLGVPTIMVVVADNQKYAAGLLEKAQAVKVISLGDNFEVDLCTYIVQASQQSSFLSEMSYRARALVSGNGCSRVVNALAECVVR